MTERMSAAQFKAKSKSAKKGRVRGTVKTTVDGIKFDSKLEARRWVELKALEASGDICQLNRQVPIPLFGQDAPILTPTARHMTYRADFTYVDWRLNGIHVVEDAKGWATDVYKIKKAVLKAQGIDIKEYTGKTTVIGSIS
jgi:hypothetical protein